jgi:hypothetical protein
MPEGKGRRSAERAPWMAGTLRTLLIFRNQVDVRELAY